MALLQDLDHQLVRRFLDVLVRSWNLSLTSTVRKRPISVNEVASAVVELAAEDCSVNGAEVTVVDGKPQVSQLSLSANSNILGSPELVVDNIVFLASDVSRPLTGMGLFPEGEIRKL